MNVRVFVDTNVLIHARDATVPAKQVQAAAWVRRLWMTRRGALSVQVLSDMGVEVVWNPIPRTRELVLVTPQGQSRHAGNARVPAHPSLPGLVPIVGEFFVQVSAVG